MTRQATPDLLGDPIPSEDPSLTTMFGGTRLLAHADIRQDGGTQPRGEISSDLVTEYITAILDGAKFPPVVVFYDGSDYWLADGFHRVRAFASAGRPVPADVRQGTQRDAVLFSLGANATHGQRRTNADKRRAVMRALDDAEWSQWSDREIARRCAVSNQFVSNIRAELPPVNDGQVIERRGGDGKVYHFENTTQRPTAPALASQEPTYRTPDEWSEPETEPIHSEISVPLVPWTKEREIGIVTIWKADSRNLTGDTSIPPVDLVITSPPYNVGIEYSEHFDKLQQEKYIDLLHNVFLGCHRVMRHGARIAVVVPFGIGRNPWQPMSFFVAAQMQKAGFELRGQIIWDKGTTGNRTSWGSFRSPSDPSLRDTCECIIVAHKSQSQAAVPHLLKDEKGSYTAWLERSEYFMELAQDHWQVAPESAQRVGHPAPFPVELVRRLVHFYGWPGCTLLDPFAGSGTVGVAAVGLDCKAHLVDIDEAYCRLAERRIKAAYQGRNMLEAHAN